jgi:putative inorganic carbon (hco3(-)) transporter
MRSLFVIALLLYFARQSLRGPFEALLFYLWIAYFRPDTWMWDPSLITALKLSFTVGLYLLVRTLPRLSSAPFDMRAVMMLLFFAISGLSTWMSERSIYLWDPWMDFGKTLVIGYVLYVLASEDAKKLRLAMVAIGFSLGFEAIKQGYMSLLLRPGRSNDNPLPQLGDNNGVAVGMLMLAALFIALSRTTTNKWEKRLHLFFLVGILYRAITTYSRGAFLALGAMTVVYIARSNQKFKAVLGALLIAAVILPVLPQRFWNRMSTMNVSSEEDLDSSSASRLHFWRVALDMAADHPLLGVGYNSYQLFYDQYDTSVGYYGIRRSVHSMWFGVLAELGYPALFIYIMVFGVAFVGMNRVMALARDGTVSPDFYHYAVALQTALVACVVGGTFLPWQYTEILWHYIALTMALRHLALKTAGATIVVSEPVGVIMRRTA